MTIEEVAKLITDLDEYEKAVEHLEKSLKRLKENDCDPKNFHICIYTDRFMDEHTIYFRHLDKLITKDMFQEFIQQCIDKFNIKISKIKDIINKMEIRS